MPEDTSPREVSNQQQAVYVVFEQFTPTVDKINKFLEEKGLKVLKKEDAVSLTGETAPFIGRVIDVAFEHAQAVIVLLTGDEKVQLCKTFQHDDDEDFEKDFSPQSTQEQLFEAGYAFGKSPKRTILVQDGNIRPFSDILGRYVLSFNDVQKDYDTLLAHLERARSIIEEEVFNEPVDPKRVFVVHGRNIAAKKAMFAFLRSLDLSPIEWDQAVELTEPGAPFTGEALVAGLDDAQAVVVLLTGDDIVQLNKQDAKGNLLQALQVRPNVLFEAGMAFSRYAKRTILVQLGKVRSCKEIDGRSLVKLIDKPASRWVLMRRLHKAGCPVNFNGDWHNSGKFNVVGCEMES